MDHPSPARGRDVRTAAASQRLIDVDDRPGKEEGISELLGGCAAKTGVERDRIPPHSFELLLGFLQFGLRR
jgi:hypothetical protein